MSLLEAKKDENEPNVRQMYWLRYHKEEKRKERQSFQ